jgi:hypothetical protein
MEPLHERHERYALYLLLSIQRNPMFFPLTRIHLYTNRPLSRAEFSMMVASSRINFLNIHFYLRKLYSIINQRISKFQEIVHERTKAMQKKTKRTFQTSRTQRFEFIEDVLRSVQYLSGYYNNLNRDEQVVARFYV